MLKSHCIKRLREGQKPPVMIILLHGFGSSGKNMISLADHIKTENIIFLSPDAPSLLNSQFGYQWYKLVDTINMIATAEFFTSVDLIHSFIDTQISEHNIAPENVFLVSFSQAVSISLQAALTYPAKLGAVVGCSGTFIHKSLRVDKIIHRIPVCLIHGDSDVILTSVHSQRAGEKLKQLKVPVTVNIIPGLDHSMSHNEVIRIIENTITENRQ